MANDWFIPPEYTQDPDIPRDLVDFSDQITARFIGQDQLQEINESITNSSIQDQAYTDEKTSGTLSWRQINTADNTIQAGDYSNPDLTDPFACADTLEALPTPTATGDFALTLKDNAQVVLWKSTEGAEALEWVQVSDSVDIPNLSLFHETEAGDGMYWFSNSWNHMDFSPDLSAYETVQNHNTSISAIETELASKQNTLTAGTNIAIDQDNVISASLIDEYKGVDYVIGVGTAAKEGVNCDLAFTDETETYDLNPVIENSDISVIHIKNFKRTGDFMLNVATITVKPTNAKTFVKIGSNDIIIKSGAVFIDNGTDDAWTPFEFNGFLLMAGANAGTRRYIVNTPGYVMPYSESFSGAMFISGANINTITNNSSGSMNISGANINTITNNSSGSMNISGANINTITNNSSGSIVVNGAEIGHIINNSSGTVTMANSRSVYYVCNNANATLKVHTGYSSIYAVGGSSATVKITGDDIYYYGHLLLSHPGVFDGVSRTYYLSRYIVFHKPASSISINVTSPAVAKGWSD